MIYTKTHTLKKALVAHVNKIKTRGGSYKIKGLTITYQFTKKIPNTVINSKNFTDLIKEAAQKGYKKVKVVWYPAFDKIKHKNIKSKLLLKSMKTAKKQILNIPEDGYLIIELLKNKDVKTINFYK